MNEVRALLEYTGCSNVGDLKAEWDGMHDLIQRLDDKLSGVVNTVRGDPPPNTLWSTHDAVELVEQVVNELNARAAWTVRV